MQRVVPLLFITFLAVLARAPAALGQASLGSAAPAAAPPSIEAPSIEARAWLLLDLRSGQVIASHAADQRVEPASLTKLMSAYVVFEGLKQKQITLDQRLPVSQNAWRMPGSRMFLEANATPTVEELLRGLIVVSGNDATIVLAEGVAGSEAQFVERMNRQAQRLGLTGTHFANATGLPDSQHYSTSADLARLAEALARDFPAFVPMYALRSFGYNGITQPNRNLLLGRDPRVDGLKTGHTEDAGYCMIATARSGERRLLAVIMGAGSESGRAIQAQRLLNYGFQYYQTVRLYGQGAVVAELPVWKGSASRLKAGLERDLYVSVPRGQGELLKASLTSLQPLLAPVSRQQPVGVLHLAFDGRPVGEYPVVALESVSVANMFMRMWDSLRLLFK
jgi:serine-type D-Ala-D-Ala carboxypeptidase (penicillin-binding protein 5/6)